MLFTQRELEQMTNYDFKVLELGLRPTGYTNNQNVYELNKDQIMKLFEQVRELTYERAQEQFSYQQQYEKYGA